MTINTTGMIRTHMPKYGQKKFLNTASNKIEISPDIKSLEISNPVVTRKPSALELMDQYILAGMGLDDEAYKKYEKRTSMADVKSKNNYPVNTRKSSDIIAEINETNEKNSSNRDLRHASELWERSDSNLLLTQSLKQSSLDSISSGETFPVARIATKLRSSMDEISETLNTSTVSTRSSCVVTEEPSTVKPIRTVRSKIDRSGDSLSPIKTGHTSMDRKFIDSGPQTSSSNNSGKTLSWWGGAASGEKQKFALPSPMLSERQDSEISIGKKNQKSRLTISSDIYMQAADKKGLQRATMIGKRPSNNFVAAESSEKRLTIQFADSVDEQNNSTDGWQSKIVSDTEWKPVWNRQLVMELAARENILEVDKLPTPIVDQPILINEPIGILSQDAPMNEGDMMLREYFGDKGSILEQINKSIEKSNSSQILSLESLNSEDGETSHDHLLNSMMLHNRALTNKFLGKPGNSLKPSSLIASSDSLGLEERDSVLRHTKGKSNSQNLDSEDAVESEEEDLDAPTKRKSGKLSKMFQEDEALKKHGSAKLTRMFGDDAVLGASSGSQASLSKLAVKIMSKLSRSNLLDEPLSGNVKKRDKVHFI